MRSVWLRLVLVLALLGVPGCSSSSSGGGASDSGDMVEDQPVEDGSPVDTADGDDTDLDLEDSDSSDSDDADDTGPDVIAPSGELELTSSDEIDGIYGTFTFENGVVAFSSILNGSGTATAEFDLNDGEAILDVAVFSEQDGAVIWEGWEYDGIGGVAGQALDSLRSLGDNPIAPALALIPLEIGCTIDSIETSQQRAALVLAWQYLIKYDASFQSPAYWEARSSCRYFPGFDDEGVAVDFEPDEVPEGLSLSFSDPIPHVFGYAPFDGDGAVEQKQEYVGPCDALCRDACGGDCAKRSCDRTLTWYCEQAERGQGEGNTGFMIARDRWICGTHSACQNHDQCYDNCNATFGCGTFEAFWCRSGWLGCDWTQCVRDYSIRECLAWAFGGGEKTPPPITYWGILYDPPPGSNFQCPAGDPPPCYLDNRPWTRQMETDLCPIGVVDNCGNGILDTDEMCETPADCASQGPCVDEDGNPVEYVCTGCGCVCPTRAICENEILEDGEQCFLSEECDADILGPCEDENGDPLPYECVDCQCVCGGELCGNEQVDEEADEECEESADCEAIYGPCLNLAGDPTDYLCDSCQCICACGPECFTDLLTPCTPAGACSAFPEPPDPIQRTCWSNGVTITLNESGLPTAAHRDGELCYTIIPELIIEEAGAILHNRYYEPDGGTLQAEGYMPIPGFNPITVTCPPDPTEYIVDLTANPVCQGAVVTPTCSFTDCPPP